MLTEREFIELVTLPGHVYDLKKGRFVDQFLEKVIGQPVEMRRTMSDIKRALAAYAKAHPLNGGIDTIQMAAVGKIGTMEAKLHRMFVRSKCAQYKANNADGEKVTMCRIHKSKMLCQKAWEDWLNAGSY